MWGQAQHSCKDAHNRERFSTRSQGQKQGATGRGCTKRGSILMLGISYSETISQSLEQALQGCGSVSSTSRCNWTARYIISSRLPSPHRDGPDDLPRSFPNFSNSLMPKERLCPLHQYPTPHTPPNTTHAGTEIP